MKKIICYILIVFSVLGFCGCAAPNYEAEISVLRNAWGPDGDIYYDGNSYIINVYEEGLCDFCSSCLINNYPYGWQVKVESANILSKELAKTSTLISAEGVTLNYYDTNGTLMISSHSGYTMYNTITALSSMLY